MARLTETDIFDCLSTNLRSAADDCEKLARLPAKGPTYHALRSKLALVEGACRQASVWREDTRWLPIGLMMEDVHKLAGNLLRHRHPAKSFLKLAENLRMLYVGFERLRHNATGRRGMILPTVPVGHREFRPVQVRTPGGILLPGAT